MIFQDPFGSLNPRMTLFDNVGEPLLVNGMTNRERALGSRRRAACAWWDCAPNSCIAFRMPSAAVSASASASRARSSTNPRLVVADEPVSALDVSVQAQVLNLLLELQSRLHLTFLFVAHDLSVVRHISDRVAVMYVGQLVELAPTKTLFSRPRHPYTAALMRAVPVPDPRIPVGEVTLKGEVPNPANPPAGCYFHPRCRFAEARCRQETPALREPQPGHFVRCHLADQLDLTTASAIAS